MEKCIHLELAVMQGNHTFRVLNQLTVQIANHSHKLLNILKQQRNVNQKAIKSKLRGLYLSL